MKLQNIDIKILSVLQHDAAISTSDLAQQVHLSQSPCWRRVNKLEESGVVNKPICSQAHVTTACLDFGTAKDLALIAAWMS